MQTNPPFGSGVLTGTGLMSPAWSGYFTGRQLKNQTVWNPEITSLTGTNEAIGYYSISERTLQFSIRITPVSSTQSTLNTTYLVLPFLSLADGAANCFNVTTKAAVGAAFIEKDTNRVWLPTWNISAPIAISGSVQVRDRNV